MARHRTGDTVIHNGVKWYLLWTTGYRDPNDGTTRWEAENELGEKCYIWLK